MPIEAPGGTIADLNPAWPFSVDLRAEGWAHLNRIKEFLQNTFAAVDDHITVEHNELNTVVGLRGPLQAQFSGAFTDNTRCVFIQASAPPGWVVDSAANDRVLRVSDVGNVTGGDWVISGLTSLPHDHFANIVTSTGIGSISTSGSSSDRYYSEDAHTHNAAGQTAASDPMLITTGDWEMAYIDALVCVKQTEI